MIGCFFLLPYVRHPLVLLSVLSLLSLLFAWAGAPAVPSKSLDSVSAADLHAQGASLLKLGRTVEAIEALRRVVIWREQNLGVDAVSSLESRLLLARAQSVAGQWDLVVPYLRETRSHAASVCADEIDLCGLIHARLGEALAVIGRRQEAMDNLRRAVSLLAPEGDSLESNHVDQIRRLLEKLESEEGAGS